MSIINQSVTYPDVSNAMPSPFDPSGWEGAVTDPDGTLVNVTLGNPIGEPFVGLATQVSGAGQLTMNGISSDGIPVVIGDKFYVCVACKPVGGYVPSVRFRIADTQGFLSSTSLLSETGEHTGESVINTNVTTLSDGFILLQVEINIIRNDSGAYGQVILWSNNDTGVAPVGAKLYVQASYFGVSPDFPGLVKTGLESVKDLLKTTIRSTIRNTNTF